MNKNVQILEVLKPKQMDHLVVGYSLVWIETEGKLWFMMVWAAEAMLEILLGCWHEEL